MRWSVCLVWCCCVPAVVTPVKREEPPVKVSVVEASAVSPAPDAEVRVVTEAFLKQVEARAFEAVWATLATVLRERYTPARLQHDFEQEPLAQERVARVRAALQGHFVIDGANATLSLGGSKAFALVREDQTWRVSRLE